MNKMHWWFGLVLQKDFGGPNCISYVFWPNGQHVLLQFGIIPVWAMSCFSDLGTLFRSASWSHCHSQTILCGCWSTRVWFLARLTICNFKSLSSVVEEHPVSNAWHSRLNHSCKRVSRSSQPLALPISMNCVINSSMSVSSLNVSVFSFDCGYILASCVTKMSITHIVSLPCGDRISGDASLSNCCIKFASSLSLVLPFFLPWKLPNFILLNFYPTGQPPLK